MKALEKLAVFTFCKPSTTSFRLLSCLHCSDTSKKLQDFLHRLIARFFANEHNLENSGSACRLYSYRICLNSDTASRNWLISFKC